MIGDVIGKPGRRAVQMLLPGLRGEHGIDFVVANGKHVALWTELFLQVLLFPVLTGHICSV